jgi:hypothetical protein
VLDVRVYRTAFLPALVALLVAAFALEDRPAPVRSALPTDAFNGARALATLDEMTRRFPSRPAGSAGDDALADYVAASLAAPAEDRRPAFSVKREFTDGRTATGKGRLETVVATRVGLSSRRIVVLAHRDAGGRPARAALSATAALLELGRVFKTRELRKTLVIVSTSAGTTGFAGARAWAESEAGGPVDAVIALGDMAGARTRKPFVVGWPQGRGAPPLALQRTVEAAVRTEGGGRPGSPRAFGQWMRRAVPITVSEQGPIAAAGLPAVLLSASGERGPAAGTPVDSDRLRAFGRAVLRSVGAIDAVGDENQPAFAARTPGIVTLRNVLPDWAVRIVVVSFLLPALLAAVDALARARRRKLPVAPALRRLAVAALPLPVAWLWLRALGATGVLPAPDGPVLPDGVPVETSWIVAMVSAALIAALATVGARLLTRRLGRSPAGLPVATGMLICGLTAVVWAFNPYAAALLLPAAHLWLFAAAGRGGRAAVVALAAGLVLPLAAVGYYELAFDLGPAQLAWGAVLGASAGAGFGSALALAGLMAALAGLIGVLVARRGMAPDDPGTPAISTRGPLTYAGPGSLGGTESALRR